MRKTNTRTIKTQINQSEKEIQSAVIEYLTLMENMGKVYFFRNN